MNALKNYNYENIALYLTFFLLWISIQFGEVVEDFLAYAMVITLGILHGANDILILSISPLFLGFIHTIKYGKRTKL